MQKVCGESMITMGLLFTFKTHIYRHRHAFEFFELFTKKLQHNDVEICVHV